jgi:hypothetical protein
MMETTVEKKLITIFVNDKPVSFNTNEVTGSEIKTKAGVPPDSLLYELRGENRIPVGDNERIKIHEHERFLATPGGVVS